jgi:DNA-directed RNA polymerase specialized sigma24 family protein
MSGPSDSSEPFPEEWADLAEGPLEAAGDDLLKAVGADPDRPTLNRRQLWYRRQREEPHTEALTDTLADPDPSAELLHLLSMREDLDTALGRAGVTLEERLIYLLDVGCNLSDDRIAWMLRTSPRTVARRLTSVRHKLRQAHEQAA